MAPALYYLCTWPAKAGGEVVNWQHVDSLVRQGWRAAVLLDQASQPLPDRSAGGVPVFRWDAHWRFKADDVLVLPEIGSPDAWRTMAALPCRRVIHNQNPFYTFNGFDDMAALDAYGFVGALCCSGFTRDQLKAWGSRMPWQVVRPYVLPYFFVDPAKSAGKVRQIAYMPRKREVDAHLLRAIFRSMFPHWKQVPWVEIRDLPRRRVAQVLAQSEIFVSLSHREGLGLPPLEAMAAGARVCGYTGGGGSDYASADNGVWVEEGDLSGLARAIDQLLAADTVSSTRMREAAQTTASRFNPTAFDAALHAAWQNILGSSHCLWRIDQDRSELHPG